MITKVMSSLEDRSRMPTNVGCSSVRSPRSRFSLWGKDGRTGADVSFPRGPFPRGDYFRTGLTPDITTVIP